MSNFRKVVLDTNFLMIPGHFGIDIFEELQKRLDFPFKVYVLRQTLDELESIIKKGSGKDKTAARIAEQLIKTQNINIIDYGEDYVDDTLVKLSEQDYIIATQDKELKARIKHKKIILRQKKYLKLVR